MPMMYNPKTGIPYWVPDLGEEIEEGKTPKPTKIASKTDAFKGDKPLTKEQYEELVARGQTPDEFLSDTSFGDKLLAKVLKKRKTAKLDKKRIKPGELDAHIATDGEVDEIEKLAKEQAIQHWPLLRRLINRLRRAEAK